MINECASGPLRASNGPCEMCMVSDMARDPDDTTNYVQGCIALYRADKLSLGRMGRKLAAARRYQAKVSAAAEAIAKLAVADGVSEVVAAKDLGINRGTLRTWLGKPETSRQRRR